MSIQDNVGEDRYGGPGVSGVGVGGLLTKKGGGVRWAVGRGVEVLRIWGGGTTRQLSLKTESRHDANFVVIGGTAGCRYDNL